MPLIQLLTQNCPLILNWSLLLLEPVVNENALQAVVSKTNTMLRNANCNGSHFSLSNCGRRAVFPWGYSAPESAWMETAAQVQQPSCLCVFQTAFSQLAASWSISHLAVSFRCSAFTACLDMEGDTSFCPLVSWEKAITSLLPVCDGTDSMISISSVCGSLILHLCCDRSGLLLQALRTINEQNP